jgi:trans-2,3-dihydro-3-hydroxyanthranilate isomerase
MQAIAREMNLSETTFILPRDAATERDRGVRVRIFTVQEELPFAGHPTLRTAFALRGDSGAREINLDLNVGTIPVQFTESPGQPAFGEMTQADPVFGLTHDKKKIADVTGIPLEDIHSELPVQTVRPEFFRRPAHSQSGSDPPPNQSAHLWKSRSFGSKVFCASPPNSQLPRSPARPHAFYNGEDPPPAQLRLRASDGRTQRGEPMSRS